MASTTKLVAGTLGSGLTWATIGFTTTDFNSLANGSCVVASSAVDNSSALDLWGEVSFSFVVGGTTLATSQFDLYWLPLNQDGTTYGDGTATGSTPPTASYRVGYASVKSGVTSGNAVTGTFRSLDGPGNQLWLPPGSGKFSVANQLGVALNATASAAIKARFFDLNLNG